MEENQSNKRSRIKNIVATVIIVVLAVLLIPIFVINLTLIIKGNVNPDVPPDIFGVAPLAVSSGSMKGDNKDSFDKGALIYIDVLGEDEKKSLEVGEIVCFKESGTFVTHRIISVTENEAGEVVSLVTKGDANNTADSEIQVDAVFGKCIGSAAGLGGFALFLQTPAGIIVFVGVPVVLFIIYDVVRITLYNKKVKAQGSSEENDEALKEKDEEIKRLRTMLDERETAEKEPQDNEATPEDDDGLNAPAEEETSD